MGYDGISDYSNDQHKRIPSRVALVGLGEGEDNTDVAPLTPSDRLSIARIASAVGFKELKGKVIITGLIGARTVESE